MKWSQQRAARRQEIVSAAVAAFDESGKAYTCRAAVFDVIGPVVARMCAETPQLAIRERQCLNLAVGAPSISASTRGLNGPRVARTPARSFPRTD